MIRYLADDPVYYARYKALVREFADGDFATEAVQTLMEQYHSLISPYVIGPIESESGKYTWLSNPSSFTSELTTLKQYVVSRHTAVDSFVQ